VKIPIREGRQLNVMLTLPDLEDY